MGESALNSIGRQDLLADRAYREIQSAIFARKIIPGATLSVPELAQQLNISRSPVREAVQRLVHNGLAVSIAHRGAVVASISADDLQKMYEVREVLEAFATRRATERLGQSDRNELQDIVEHHREVLGQEKSVTSHIELDMQFHKRIRELAENRYLADFLDTLQGQIRIAMHSLWRSDDAPRHALEEHEKILAAMMDSDPDEAEAATRAHIRRVRSNLTESNEYWRQEET